MIVFGTRGKVVAGPRKQGVVCASCGKEEHATYGVLRYFHVFWIPLFPTMKQPMMECLHCKKVLTGKEVPERVRRDVADKVFTRARVLPLFTGLAAIGVFAAFAASGAAEESRREAAFLAAPAVGDTYVVKLARFAAGTDPKYPYGVLRVSSISGANLELQVGRFGYSGPTAAASAIRTGQIAAAQYFAAEPMTLPMRDLQPLKTQGAIHSVRRR